jgi:hypothetical protein
MVSPHVQSRKGRLYPRGNAVYRQCATTAATVVVLVVVVRLTTTSDDANDDAVLAHDDAASTHDDDAAPVHDDVASAAYDVHAARRSDDGTAQPRLHDGSWDASYSHELPSSRISSIIPWNACPLSKCAPWWPS